MEGKIIQNNLGNVVVDL